MKFFISGGAGFIGSHMSEHLLSLGHEVKVFDNLTSGTMSHIEKHLKNPHFQFTKGDIKDLNLLTDAMKGSEVVIHFAANPDIAKAVKQPDIDFWEGTYLTQNILEAMRVNNVSTILYTSGSGVYGDMPNIEFSENYGPCFPISTYGASKLACEVLISSYAYMFGIQGRAFRFANVVGAKQTHGVGYDFMRRLKINPKELQILGDGTQTKSYIHVSDVISAMMFIFKNKTKDPFDVFNVATEEYITVNQIAEECCKLYNIQMHDIHLDYTGGDRGWKGDVPKILFDTNKIRSLGWKNQHSSLEAIRLSLVSLLDENNT